MATKRVFATCDIGESIELLRKRGYEVEVYPGPEAPPKSLIIEKVKSGVDGLITTLRDKIDAEVFEAGKGKLKVVAQIAVGFDNINRADANRYKVPSPTPPTFLPKPLRSSPSSRWARWRANCGRASILSARTSGARGTRFFRSSAMR